MRYRPDYSIPVDMRSLIIEVKDFGPGDITSYSGSHIAFKEGFSYEGDFKWKKKGDKRILKWKKIRSICIQKRLFICPRLPHSWEEVFKGRQKK